LDRAVSFNFRRKLMCVLHFLPNLIQIALNICACK
jgi:hypothetical protein